MRADHWNAAEREEYCYRHARARLMSRYHCGISKAEYRRLCALLAYGTRNPLAYSWDRREILIIWHAGRPTKAVFCPVDGLIVTFLPWRSYERDWYDPHAKHRDRKKEKQRKITAVRKSGKRINRKKRHDQRLTVWEDE